MSVRILQIGLGPIGAAVARQGHVRPGFELVGAVDPAPEKAGRDLGLLCGLGKAIGVKIVPGLDRAPVADVAIVCTSSSLEAFARLVEPLVERGLRIVSTTEELAHPFRAHPEIARRLDEIARRAGVAILGTGVNPGFAMDALAITLTAPCERVDRIEVDRFQDASQRRIPFQRKIGATLSPDTFRGLVERGELGHVGFAESVAMIAASLGWRLDRTTDEIEPKIATESIDTEIGQLEAGRVSGIVQHATGSVGGVERIVLHMEAYLDAPESYDEVRIEGSPPLCSRIAGGIPGDIATASITLNVIPQLLAAAPGLRTMRDVGLPSWWSGRSPS